MMLSTQHIAAERSISWMGTQRRCPARDAQLAVDPSLRGQATVGWRGLGPRDREERTRRMPLREYVLVS